MGFATEGVRNEDARGIKTFPIRKIKREFESFGIYTGLIIK